MMASGNEYLNKIPLFDGTKDSCSISNFFAKFEVVADNLKWTPDKKVFFLKIRLQGAAKDFVTGINSKNYATLKSCLIKKFSVEKNDSEISLSNVLEDFPQQADMPVEKFIEKVESHSLMIQSKSTLNAIHRGLLGLKIEKDILLSKMNPEIIEGVKQRNPKSLEQIKEFAILEEKKINAAKDNQKTEISTTIMHPQILQGTREKNLQAVKHVKKLDIPVKRKRKAPKDFEEPETSNPKTSENDAYDTIEGFNRTLKELEAQVSLLTDNVFNLERALNPN